MKIVAHFGILASVAFSSLAAANLPPPPPPDPLRLAEAERLMAVLPLENVFGSGFNAARILGMTTDQAVLMLSKPSQEQDESLEEVFRAKVRMVAEDRLNEAINDARRNLAEEYAYRLKVNDLANTRAFAVTDEGKAFLKVQLDRDSHIPNIVSRLLYRRLSGDLPQILQDARESNRLMQRVNDRK